MAQVGLSGYRSAILLRNMHCILEDSDLPDEVLAAASLATKFKGGTTQLLKRSLPESPETLSTNASTLCKEGAWVPCCCCTNSHTHSDLKRCKLIVLSFCKSEGQNQSHWAEVQVSGGWLLLESLKSKSASLPFQLTEDVHRLCCGPFLHLHSQQCNIFDSL